MDTPTLLPLLQQQSNFLLALWLAFVAGAVAAVAVAPLVAKHRTAFRTFLMLVALAAFTHLMCLQWILKQWDTLAGELKAKLAADPALIERLAGNGYIEAPAFGWVVPFHLVVDVALLVGLWLIGRAGRTASGNAI